MAGKQSLKLNWVMYVWQAIRMEQACRQQEEWESQLAHDVCSFFISTTEITEIERTNSDYQLSKEWQTVGDPVLMFNLCCHGQMAPLSMATRRLLMSLLAKCRKLQAMISIPLEMKKVACGNTVQISVTKAPSCLTQLWVRIIVFKHKDWQWYSEQLAYREPTFCDLTATQFVPE